MLRYLIAQIFFRHTPIIKYFAVEFNPNSCIQTIHIPQYPRELDTSCQTCYSRTFDVKGISLNFGMPFFMNINPASSTT